MKVPDRELPGLVQSSRESWKGEEWPPPSLDPPHHQGGVGGDGERGGGVREDGVSREVGDIKIFIITGRCGRVTGSRYPHKGASPSLP